MHKSIKTILFPLQSNADYWLLSDADVSITDMWRTERILSVDILVSITLAFSCFYIKKIIVFSFVLKFLNTSTAGVEWNELDALNEDYFMTQVSTPRPQTPPSNTSEVPSANPPGS